MNSSDIIKDTVASVAKSLPETKEELTLALVIEKLHHYIVNLYEGGDYAEYKRRWLIAVITHYKAEGIDLVSFEIEVHKM